MNSVKKINLFGDRKICIIFFLLIILLIFFTCQLSDLPDPDPESENPGDDSSPSGNPQVMVTEAWKYVNNSRYWLGRQNEDDLIGYVCFMQGVAYSYGNKDTYGHFNTKINASGFTYCPDYWYEYTNHYKPGLHTTEIDWSSSKSWGYPLKWAGIDCSGLVQRCAYKAGYKDIPNIGDGKINEWGGYISSGDFPGYSDYICNQKGSYTNVKVGDIVLYPGHIVLVSDVSEAIQKTNINKVLIIQANGGPWWVRKVTESEITEPGYSFTIRRLK